MAPHILITTQVFPPEIHPTAVMVKELAVFLQDRGWRVTVAAGYPHHPHGRLYSGYRKRPWLRENVEGVDVLRVWHATSPNRAIPIRAAVFASQGLAAALAGAFSKKADVVLVYGPPLVGPTLGWAVAKIHRARLANVIYDIYPDVAIETGHVTYPPLIAAARSVERFQYRVTDRTIVLSEGFKRTLMAKGVEEHRIAVLPVWLDPDEIRPMSRDNAWRHEQGIPLDKLVVLYAGTIGIVSGATVVADAAAILKDRPDVLFMFVGSGAARDEVEQRARTLGLTNMRFLPFQPRERLAEVQATADIGLVTLAPGRGKTSVPSKVLGYMAAGRPTVASVDEDSDTAEQVVRSNGGTVCGAVDPDALAIALRNLISSSEQRQTMGSAARAHFVENYARPSVLERYAEILQELQG